MRLLRTDTFAMNDIPNEMPGSSGKTTPNEHSATVAGDPGKTVPAPQFWIQGYSIEHILISVMVVHTNRIIQYDDSCAFILEKALKEYGGVVRVETEVHYKHCKTDIHGNGCSCGICKPQTDVKCS